MMQAADLGNRDDAATAGRLGLTFYRSVAVQGQMRPRANVVLEERFEDPLEMPFVEHDNMVQTLSSDRSDQAFYVRVLPGRSGCDNHLSIAFIRYALSTIDLRFDAPYASAIVSEL